MDDPQRARLDEYLDAIDREQVFQEIADYLADVPELTIDRLAEVGGRYAAVFSYQPHKSYCKGFASPWYTNLHDLRQSVIDTFALVKTQEELDVNIFSAAMFEYLSAEMLGNKPISMTIKAVEEQEVAGPRGTDVKVIVTFNERPKKLILNKTNARALAAALGPETDHWRGASVAMAVENVKVGRNTVPSVRVKSATAAASRNGNTPKANDVTAAEPAVQPALTDAPLFVTDGAYEEA